jgi:hypothetical protein
MIVSNEHVERMADLTEDGISDLEALADEWIELLTKEWGGPCFIFEHGGRTPSGGNGGCVSHAHMQLLPLYVQPTLDDTHHDVPSLREALLAAGDQSYLLTSHGSGWSTTMDDSSSGQFFRRQICTLLGTPGEWDYLVYPRHDLMRETIDRLTALGNGS